MLERWTIEPSPTPRDSNQHILFLKAEKLDVYGVLREFGAMCGRPQKTSKDDYNYSIVLHGISPQDLQNIEKFLNSLSGTVIAAKTPVALEPTTPPPEPISPASERQDRPQEGGTVSLRPRESTVDLPAGQLIAPPPPPEAPIDPLTNEPLYGAVFVPNPLQTFDTLIVGPFNRFAHAAGTAVVANPGSMYNPLILFGAPGVGKSHFLAAIGRSLQERADGKPVFFTTGCKLSWAADAAAAQDKMKDLISYAEGSAGLLIDDVHLMTFSERNQAGLKSIMHHYWDAGKPVIMTSVYAPRALQFLEEALQFQIGSGYTVEIKLAGAEVRLQILRAVMMRLDFDVVDEAAKELQAAMGPGFLELNRWIRRMRALKLIHAARGSRPSAKEMLAPLLGKIGQPLFARATANASPPPSVGTAGGEAITLMLPVGQENHAQQMFLRFKDAVQRLELQLPAQMLTGQAYDSNQLYGVYAAVGEACRRSGASAVLMAGPTLGSPLAAHEGELHHALDHILAGLKLPLSLIPFSQLQDPTVYLQAVLDVYLGLWAPWQP